MTYMEIGCWTIAFKLVWERLGAGAALTEGQIEYGSSIIFLLMIVAWMLMWIKGRE